MTIHTGIQPRANCSLVLRLDGDLGVFASIASARFSVRYGMRELLIFGDVHYVLVNGIVTRIASTHDFAGLGRVLCAKTAPEVQEAVEGNYICLMIDHADSHAWIFGDCFARVPLFVKEAGGYLTTSTSLQPLFNGSQPGRYDPLMVAHLLSTYGWYTPQGKTIYSDVRELAVREVITLSRDGITSKLTDFKPQPYQNYDEARLDQYYEILRNSVLSRANPDGVTWVSASGGWDTGIITGILASECDAKNIRLITARLCIGGDSSYVLNEDEITRVDRLARHYGLHAETVDLNFDRSDAPYWIRECAALRETHTYAFCTTYFKPLSDYLHCEFGPGAVILNGETSDSFHNFGFSQHKTLLHSVPSFCEYADKMNCYLFGPTFYRKVLDGSFEDDVVFKLLMSSYSCEPYTEWSSKREMLKGYLYPFFYGSGYGPPRLPFAVSPPNPLLTHKATHELYNFFVDEYVPWVADQLDAENIYSILTHLYNLFHCQGGTVAAHKVAMQFNGHHMRLPFHDIRLVNFLSVAPEDWGRGLEFRSTKFPLKYAARNKPELRYPFKETSSGPRGLRDRSRGHSLYGDAVINSSGLREYFIRCLEDPKVEELLDPTYFDLNYVQRLRSDYRDGAKLSGQALRNAMALISMAMVGAY